MSGSMARCINICRTPAHASHPTSQISLLQVPTCSGEFKQALVSLLDDVKAGRLARQQQQAQQQLGVHGSPVAASDEAAEAVAALAVG